MAFRFGFVYLLLYNVLFLLQALTFADMSYLWYPRLWEPLVAWVGAHVLHLEGLVAARERVVVERDAQLAVLLYERAAWQRREGELAAAVASARGALDSARQAIVGPSRYGARWAKSQ